MAEKRGKKGRRPGRRPRLSLCMIARDEAGFLEQCLESVRGLADEVVVVDTGSRDQTAQVARRFGARVSGHAWQGDFAAARNQGLELAAGEWILVLDCDEVLSRQDHERLRQLLRRAEADAFRLTTRNYTDERDRAGWTACGGTYREEKHYQGWFPTTKVRLWRNLPGIRFAGAVHELVEDALLAQGLAVGDCLVPVHHYGYAEKVRPVEQYLLAGEEKVRQQPGDLRARYELSLALRDAGRLAEALQRIDEVWGDLERTGQAQVYLQEEFVLLVRADLLDRMRRWEQATAAYRQILERFPDSYQACNNLGSLLERQGRFAEARPWYERGARIAPDNPVLRDNLARLQQAGEQRWRLSVCLIVRDEEARLGRCLESLRGVADQVVVVDTGSVDRTVEVAERFGARVGHFAWGDDFAAARNASLDLAEGEWIAWLDADEYLLPADRQKLAQLKQRKPEQAFSFTLVNEGQDRSCFRQVKMFPHHPQVRFERPVHETVLPSLQRLGIPVVAAQVEVRHTGYAEAARSAAKKRYYLGLMEQWLESHPQDYYLCFRVGHTWYTEKEYGRAREWFGRILDAGYEAIQPPSVFRLALVFCGRAWLEQGECESALPLLEQALQLQPDEVLAHLTLGDLYTKLGRYSQALEHLPRVLDGHVDPNFPLDLGLVEYSARFFTGQCCQALGRLPEAAQAFAAARQLLPERPEAAAALEQLGEAEVRPGPGAQGDVPPKADAVGEAGQRLSLCMIVRDEEARLGACLESVQGLVDEIVVVDTGSVDRTVEVAERFGARTGYFAWCDDFAAARNASVALATGDWILWLDADDRLPREYHAQIRQLLGQGRGRAYFFVLDDHGYENVSCLQMRLFPNLPGVAFEMPIHEQVTPSLGRLKVEMVPTDIRVVHTGYSTPEVVRAKKDRYLRIMEQWLEKHPEDYIVRSHVALTYHSTGRLEAAIAAYRRILYDSTCWQDRNLVVYTTSLLFLGRTYLKQQDYTRALDYALQAQAVDPDYVLTKVSLAEIYTRLGEYPKALDLARAVLEGERQMTFFPVDQGELRYSALFLCGQAYQHLGQPERAEEAFLQAAAVPVAKSSEALGALSELYKARGDRPRALEVLRRAHQQAPDHAQHLFNLGVLHLEQRELEEAAACFAQVCEQIPDYAPALLNLGYIAKLKGQPGEAERIYRHLVQVQPEGVEARANLGHLYLAQERFTEAVEVFRQLRELDQSLLDVDLGLLRALTAGGGWDEGLAREVLAPVPEVAVDLADAQAASRTFVRLGAALLKRALPKCAEFAFAVAVDLDRNFLEARRGLAELLQAQGEYWKAVAQYEAILLARPRDAEAFRRLGDCYQRLGAEEAAQLSYQRSRELQADQSSGPSVG